MRQAIRFVCLVLALTTASTAWAQQVWVQIEAQPSLREAEQRARAYAGTFTNVNGFAMSTGWYAIALGPFAPAEAERQLGLLRGERLIPRDSFIETGSTFRRQFWPVGAAVGALRPSPDSGTGAGALPDPGNDTLTTPALPDSEPAIALPRDIPRETLREAQQSERALTGEERMDLQRALQWHGFYTAAIDGAFGPGTRRSMADWQAANAFETTGVLTTAQRAALLQSYRDELAALGIETVRDEQAGIVIDLPLNLVAFSRYETPFAHYDARDDSGVQILLISQNGDQTTLSGLYDVMQTLEIVPLQGERSLGRTSFSLSGQNAERSSHTEAFLSGDEIKGYTIVWTPAAADRAARIRGIMQSSFAPIEGAALNAAMASPSADQRSDMLAGLDMRRPTVSRSGFYMDDEGRVLTSTQVLQSCGRITLDGTTEADVSLQDDTRGVAVLTPRTTLSPPHIAAFRIAPPRLRSEVAVAGYSYEDLLDSAVLTFGTLEELRSLDGNAEQSRLALNALDGDVGGPVLDQTGAVIGLLLGDQAPDGKVLPAGVGHALGAAQIVSLLTENGLSPAAADSTDTLSEAELTRRAQGMTVLVSCWN